jgi:SAM-dependent methyltransferase
MKKNFLYSDYLKNAQEKKWKKLLNVQYPYRKYLIEKKLGKTIDVGCGIGRNLAYLDAGSVGVDIDPGSVDFCRDLGLSAYSPDDFLATINVSYGFESLLLSHILEHFPFDEACSLVKTYLPFLKPGARVLIITPQEVGFNSDCTHMTFFDFDLVASLCASLGLMVVKQESFPFSRVLGKVFKYNEFICLARKA